MKRFAILMLLTLWLLPGVKAQTFTQHLQQAVPGKGKVTVRQSKDVDDLVNGLAQRRDTTVRRRPVAVAGDDVAKKRAAVVAAQEHGSQERAGAQERANVVERQHSQAAAQESEAGEMHIPTVDMRKKVMRGSRKVTGFRVQAFAGGNTRADRQKAQQVGDAIKMKYPEVPVYVHFYSPRWICRVGNFRTYAEAEAMLKAVKAMGYKSATVVKGKITVFE